MRLSVRPFFPPSLSDLPVTHFHRHSREGGNPGNSSAGRCCEGDAVLWIPAFAGMTEQGGE
ncbi:hypothetical protein GE253_16640 [Niveispirillum sp. SYP-B3756]|nr:hypothetical protein [Niveispirillum sp. SYP-B3756]